MAHVTWHSLPLVLGSMLLAGIFYWLWARHMRVREAKAVAVMEDMAALGEVVPETLYPKIDLDRCIGSGGCVRACPEKQVLEVVQGLAKLVNPLACVAHGACVTACPVKAIELVFGTVTHGVELPRVDANYQTARDGVYVIGELSGMGLIRNAVRQGRHAADHVVRGTRRGVAGAFDAVVVGAGPAGLSAGLRLMEAGMRAMVLEREAVGNTIVHYPRAKVVMTGALELAIVGTIKRRSMSKEEMVDLWQSIVARTHMPVHIAHVEGVAAEPDGMWRLETSGGHVRAANVLLGLGRRGTPRKLEVPGEEQVKVHYALIEPEQFAGKHVLVVGGGNSAVESALALSDFGRCASVSISYRRHAFARCREENRRRIKEAIASGAVHPLMSSEVKRIGLHDVTVALNDREGTLPNDAVIIQIGGTAPSELLKQFGVDVVTKYGEA
jgi:thioredoxin reductase (NADPH)